MTTRPVPKSMVEEVATGTDLKQDEKGFAKS